jgi:hypothetical protein
MNGENKSHLCPLCGGKRKPGTDTADARGGRSALRKPPTAVAHSVVAESSDDKTANDFAALLLRDQKKRFLSANK